MTEEERRLVLPDDAPDQLCVMRLVSIGQSPNSSYGRALADWMKAKPVAFQEKLMELELAYWNSKRGKPTEFDAEAKVDEDFGHLREWLRSHGGE